MIRYITLLCALVPSLSVHADSPIDRRALVERHCPVLHEHDPLAPLTVGNGEFAFTADITGLQTFSEAYRDGIPLSTQSNWGWHTFPNPASFLLASAMREYDAQGRKVAYASITSNDAGKWLRENPHRLGLGRIGFVLTKEDGTHAKLEDLHAIEQKLDLWSGMLHSCFELEGQPVDVVTTCHPKADLLAVRVGSPLIRLGRLKVAFRFPYGSGRFGKEPEDWTQPDAHETQVVAHKKKSTQLLRTLDDDSHHVLITHSPSCRFTEAGEHEFQLAPSSEKDGFEFSAAFSLARFQNGPPAVSETLSAGREYWEQFWTSGGAIDFSGSTDPRAHELERRVVLSQYLTAIQCSGSVPPQETGLTFNSWYGKFHLEMHWWHAVHFALWGRMDLLEKSLPWYKSILPMARKTARLQGYRGARWPKMIGPDGREGPSGVGVFLIWQQPHPIYYAELCYRAIPSEETLKRYQHARVRDGRIHGLVRALE